MSLIGMLVGCLGVLLRHVGLLLAFGVVAPALMLGGRPTCLGRIFVVFSGLVVVVSAIAGLVL